MTTQAPASPPFPPGAPSTTDFTAGRPIYVASVGAEIPPALPVEQAVRDGLISEENAKIAGYTAVSIADESTSVLDLAAGAARKATARANVPPTDIRSLLFVSVFPYSHPTLYNMPAAIAEIVRTPAAFATQIATQSCAASIDTLILAGHRLLLTDDRAALVVAGEMWRHPYIDRFNCEPGYIFSDGAAALVLSREPGYARLLSGATLTDPVLSGLTDPLLLGPDGDAPATGKPVDLTLRAREFLQNRMGTEAVLGRLRGGLRATIDAALGAAGVALDDVPHVIVPAIGETFLHRNYLEPLNIPVSRTTWDHTAVTGHNGAGDQYIALAHLVESGRADSGDHILLIAEGLGFQWSVAVLQVE